MLVRLVVAADIAVKLFSIGRAFLVQVGAQPKSGAQAGQRKMNRATPVRFFQERTHRASLQHFDGTAAPAY